MMVGDHPLDILSGKKTGTRTIGVLTGRTGAAELEAAQADLVLSDVTNCLVWYKLWPFAEK